MLLYKSIHQEDIKIVNVYVPNMRTPKYVMQLLPYLKREIDNHTIIEGSLIPNFQ